MVRISDKYIIDILMENSRIPFVKIAEKLGVSETAIRKRIKKLEKEKVILKYTIEVDPKKIGYEVVSFIGLDTLPEYYIQTLEKLKKLDKVRKLYTSSGDHMFMMECWFRNSSELTEFLSVLKQIQGVKRICPAIILERIK